MLPFQQRVLDEKADLDKRLAALRGFFMTQTYVEMNITDRALLVQQEGAMVKLAGVLAVRITRFEENTMPKDEPKLPRWQCHKQVDAAQILSISHGRLDMQGPGSTLHFSVGTKSVSDMWMTKHNPEVGGYFVVYDDSYSSYSPAAAFEGGYTLLP